MRELGSVSGATLVVGAVALAVLLALRFVMPKLPAALLVVVTRSALSWALDLQSHGVAVVGAIPAGLPSFDVPSPAWQDIFKLVPAAVGIFLVSFADEILTARSFAGKHGQHVRASQELLAMGAANAAAGFTQSFSIGASGSRTAVNDDMGARSQIAGLVAARRRRPDPALPHRAGAVPAEGRARCGDRLRRDRARRPPRPGVRSAAVDPVEVAIAAVTTGCVVVFGVLEALGVAVGLSVIDTVRRSARPHDAVLGWVERLGRYADVSLHPSARVTPGVVVYRLDDRLFFANARYFKGRVHEAIRAAPTRTSWLVLDAEAITHVDSTGLDALEELTENLRRDGITLVVARLRTRMEEQFEGSGLTDDDRPRELLPIGPRGRGRIPRRSRPAAGHRTGRRSRVGCFARSE